MKRQKWLTGILAVMLVTSLMLAVGGFAWVSSAHAGGGVTPDDPCAYFDCHTYWGYCECPGGGWGCATWCTHCCYNPYPAACYRCPSPCCWCYCYCNACGWGTCS